MRPAEPARRRAAGLDRLLSIAAFLLLWWLLARTSHSPSLLPGPWHVLAFAWQQTLSGDLPRNIAFTLARVAAAFTLSMLLGASVGYLMGRSRRADAWLDPWVIIALNLPVLVVVILAYIWIGLNDVAAVLAVTVAKMPTVVVTVREGARALDPGLEELAAVYHVPALRRLRRIVLPQLAPYLAAAGRSGLSITWKIVLIVELLGRPNGVGFALNLFFQNFNVAGILAYGLAFAAVMLVVETALVQPWERRARAWRLADA
ncbi:MAG TPA: ABC transporter permease subunit [Acetobacteraceae bacterium]|nr:ABC transporter permease subunit [Acetobacteraceae bacterium]